MIADVQRKLNVIGYLDDAVDGVYGSATEAAVKKLQNDYKIPVSGAVDEETLAILTDTKKSKKVMIPRGKLIKRKANCRRSWKWETEGRRL
ncbi:MAG: peptidoglycan-binding domain-containing protein [Dialister sp.]